MDRHGRVIAVVFLRLARSNNVKSHTRSWFLLYSIPCWSTLRVTFKVVSVIIVVKLLLRRIVSTV